MNKEKLWEEIQNLVRLAIKAREAEIDASACQTSRDFENMHKKQEEYYEAEEALENKINDINQ